MYIFLKLQDNDNHASINLDNYTYADENKYKIDNVNVGELFKKYQLKAAKQIKEKGCFLESDIQELLAMNNILLIKPGQTSPLVSSIFNEACILSIQHEIKQIFGIIDAVDIHTDVKVKIEEILKVGIFKQFVYQLTYRLVGYKITYNHNDKSCQKTEQRTFR